MIYFLDATPEPLGNALSLYWKFDDARGIRILRRTDTNFSGPEDSDAHLVYEGEESGLLLDFPLENGTTYYYRAWTYNDLHQYSEEFYDASGTPNFALEGRVLPVEEVIAKFVKKAFDAVGIKAEVLKAYPLQFNPLVPLVIVSSGEGGDEALTAGDMDFETEALEDPTITRTYHPHRQFRETVTLELLAPNADWRARMFRIMRQILLVLTNVLATWGYYRIQINWGPDLDIKFLDTGDVLLSKVVTISYVTEEFLEFQEIDQAAQVFIEAVPLPQEG